ncbi:MAG TPA: hypothetical protein VIW45_16820 [Vicinamibacterales bacterium]|jgi:ribosomal protein S16
MRKLFLGCATAALCSAVLFAADDRVRVTLNGCVNGGDSPNTYVLTDVSEVSQGKKTPATAVYWLDSTKEVRDHTGQRVEIVGSYSPSRDAGKTAKVKVETDRDGGTKIAVENGAKKAEAAEPLALPVGTSGTKTEEKRPYRRLQVESVTKIADSCR